MKHRQADTYCTGYLHKVFHMFLSVCLTGLQPVHVLQPDDVSLVEVEQTPVLGDVVPHCHHVLRVLTKEWQVWRNASPRSFLSAWFTDLFSATRHVNQNNYALQLSHCFAWVREGETPIMMGLGHRVWRHRPDRVVWKKDIKGKTSSNLERTIHTHSHIHTRSCPLTFFSSVRK